MKSFILLLFITLTGLLFSPLHAQEAPATGQPESITFKVKGITCSGDLPIINKNVEALEGVEKCEAVGDAKPTTSFSVTFQPGKVERAQIVEAIENSPSCDFPDQKPYRVKK